MNFDDKNKLSWQQSGLKHATILLGEYEKNVLFEEITYNWINNIRASYHWLWLWVSEVRGQRDVSEAGPVYNYITNVCPIQGVM